MPILNGANPKVNQQHLATVLKSLFTEHHIITNARKGGNLRVHQSDDPPKTDMVSSGQYLELDFWIPALRIAFEYQDPHHYTSTYYATASIGSIQNSDKMKKAIMKDRGDNLIIVPCWWQGDVNSLVTTIRNERYDLLTDRPIVCGPIPPTPPDDFFKVFGVPGIGELMIPSFPRVAQFSIIGWWVSEKYDGVRICWHGSQKTLFSRYGRLIPLSERVLSKFPPVFLDGEAWNGRGGFNEVQEIMNLQDEKLRWDFFRVPVFDTPDPTLASLPFEKRFGEILSHVPSEHPLVVIASNLKCKTDSNLSNFVQSVLQHDGEGIVTRKPESLYHHGLTDALWKFKASRDLDALVIEEDSEDGSFVLKLPNDMTFNAKIRPGITAPVVGQIVSLSYTKYLQGQGPINPKIERVREDIEWDEVVANAHMRVIRQGRHTVLNHYPIPRLSAGYWNEAENVKLFFDEIARKHNFDPYDTHSWYGYSMRDIIAEGGGSMLARYSHSLLRALTTAYPDSVFMPHMFSTVPRNYWTSSENRRQFLLDFALKKDFDAAVPENWYHVTFQDLMEVKGGAMVLHHHDKSVAQAVCDLLPDIDLDPTRFKAPRGYFATIRSQRDFFERFAGKAGFHPLKSSAWRSITKAQILAEPGGPTVLNKHKTLPSALSTLFPELGCNVFKNLNPRYYWNDPGNRKLYFESIAKQGRFDPLIAESWYSVHLNSFVKQKGYKSMLNYYNGSIVTGLITCFPHIGLDPVLLSHKLNVRHADASK